MTDTIHTETIQVTILPKSLPFASQPWTSFYRAGETIRELRKALEGEASAGAEGPSREEEATSRMDDEGCPNEHVASLPAAKEYSRVGGRLLLVGSPIF